MTFKRAYLSPCTGIPEADGAVSGAGGEQASIRRPCYAADITGMPRKSVEGLPGRRVPEADGGVTGAGGGVLEG
jgi:hypothetical protein